MSLQSKINPSHRTSLRWLASAILAVIMFPALQAEPRCPGNVASIRPRIVNNSLMIIQVMLDGSGPYDFVVDTGAQITTIDPALAEQLHPVRLGATHVTGLGTYSRAEYGQLELLRAGTFSLKTPLIIIQDLWGIQRYDPQIRGILGENFLAHFDLLIDNAHRVLCLDDSNLMRGKVKGERIALAPPSYPERYLPFTQPMVIRVHVSDATNRPLLFELDSGAIVPVLFTTGSRLPAAALAASPERHRSADEVAQAFAVLPPMELRIGGHAYPQILFMTPVAAGRDIPVKPDVDGVVPTSLFRSVFISYADHFAVLEPQ